VEIRQADHVAPSIRKKLSLTSLTSGGRSVGIVRSRTQATKFFNTFFAFAPLSAKSILSFWLVTPKYVWM
jgi:hypothetical protein